LLRGAGGHFVMFGRVALGIGLTLRLDGTVIITIGDPSLGLAFGPVCLIAIQRSRAGIAWGWLGQDRRCSQHEQRDSDDNTHRPVPRGSDDDNAARQKWFGRQEEMASIIERMQRGGRDTFNGR
jgi:hypothetical protein